LKLKKQRELIEYLISSPDTFTICHSIIDHEFFDPSLQPVVKFILDYYEEYSAVPSPKQIDSETDLLLEEYEIEKHQIDYTVNEIEKFCKKMALQDAIMESAKLIDTENSDDIEELIKEALLLSVHNDLGVNYYEDIEERLERLKHADEILPTKLPNFNEKLGGGPARKELLLFAAGSGGGKSVCMSNLALDYADNGYNVLYVSLELSQDIVCQRFDTMITGISRKVWIDHIPEIINGVRNYRTAETGQMDVIYMPSESKPMELRSYLKNYHLHRGCMPDVILVDYLDKMTPNKRVNGNSFDIDKKISEQLRQIGVDHDALIVSASQLNRSAVGEDEHNHSHIAGGISKINESDTFVTIYMNTLMRTSGDMKMSFQKTRNSDGVGSSINMTFNENLRISAESNDLSLIGKNSSKKNSNHVDCGASIIDMFDNID